MPGRCSEERKRMGEHEETETGRCWPGHSETALHSRSIQLLAFWAPSARQHRLGTQQVLRSECQPGDSRDKSNSCAQDPAPGSKCLRQTQSHSSPPKGHLGGRSRLLTHCVFICYGLRHLEAFPRWSLQEERRGQGICPESHSLP